MALAQDFQANVSMLLILYPYVESACRTARASDASGTRWRRSQWHIWLTRGLVTPGPLKRYQRHAMQVTCAFHKRLLSVLDVPCIWPAVRLAWYGSARNYTAQGV